MLDFTIVGRDNIIALFSVAADTLALGTVDFIYGTIIFKTSVSLSSAFTKGVLVTPSAFYVAKSGTPDLLILNASPISEFD